MYCSTTSVPKPRTSRTMGPRFTVSIHTVAAIHRRRRGLQPGEPPGDQRDGRHQEHNVYDPANQFPASDFFTAGYIHGHGRFLLMSVRKYSSNVDITEK